MKKLKTLFVMDRTTRDWFRATEHVQPSAEWVLRGEGQAYRKRDGTACLVRDGELWKRYDAKKNGPPSGAIPCIPERDPVTGHWPHWVRVTDSDIWHMEAFSRCQSLVDGTYELCGPKVNSNREGFSEHVLIPHDGEPISENFDLTYVSIKEFLFAKNKQEYFEGIVWHHPNGEMIKIRFKDFKG